MKRSAAEPSRPHPNSHAPSPVNCGLELASSDDLRTKQRRYQALFRAECTPRALRTYAVLVLITIANELHRRQQEAA